MARSCASGSGLHPRSATRLLRRAGGAGHARARGRPLRQHAGDRPVPRPGQALVRRRAPGDGQRPAVSGSGARSPRAFGPASRRTRPRSATTSSRPSTPTPTGWRSSPRAMSSMSVGAGQAIAAKFPWQDHSSVIDIGCAEGAVPVQIALAHEHVSGGGFDLPPLAPIFDSYVRPVRARRPPELHGRRLLRRPAARGGRARDGAHPSRLGLDREAASCCRRPTTPCPTAAH